MIAVGTGAFVCGTGATAGADNAVALGTQAQALATLSLAAGFNAIANAGGASALGANTLASGASSVAVGHVAIANGDDSVAMGHEAIAVADQGIAVGLRSRVGLDAFAGVAIGRDAFADQESAIALGSAAQALGIGSLALGASAQVVHDGSVALGLASMTSVGAQTGYAAFALAAPQTSVGEVSIGNPSGSRKLTHVAAGSADTDAVNVAQLRAVQVSAGDALLWDAGAGAFSANHLGAGPNRIVNLGAGLVAAGSTEAINGGQLYGALSSVSGALVGDSSLVNGGVLLAPQFVLGGNVFNDVASALQFLDAQGGASDARFTAQDAAPASASGSNSVAAGSNAQANAPNSVALGANSVADRANTVSVGAAGAERQVANVADGASGTDAVNVRQMQAQSVTTLNQANAYTDQRVTEIVAVPMQAIEDLRGQVDDQFRQTDRRINRHGAMNAAMVHMASSAANIQTTNRVSVGAGYAEGQEALAVGYQRQLKPNVSVSLGAAFSGSEQSAGAGIGIGW
ncbi:YadA-like family protein [Lysobacter changpingensis]|uniref:YadA-like family protein n=1 Tax=Lysobacter changpingensis TaxID=2792784 RepID=UPI001A8EDECE|nr:YadA-like family protein [Lysobacter changpingensis]